MVPSDACSTEVGYAKAVATMLSACDGYTRMRRADRLFQIIQILRRSSSPITAASEKDLWRGAGCGMSGFRDAQAKASLSPCGTRHGFAPALFLSLLGDPASFWSPPKNRSMALLRGERARVSWGNRIRPRRV
jgi:hypothetical protein